MEFLSVLALCFALQAPTPKLRGKVLDQKGSPRIGAEVILVSPGIPHIRETQVLRAQTGKRGRFHFSLNPGRTYLAWSHFKDEKGMHFFSPKEKGVIPGKILVLKEDRSRTSQSVRLGKLSAWGKPEEMRVRWDLDGKGGFVLEEPVNAKGEVKVPDLMPWALSGLRFSLGPKNGRTLFGGKVWGGKSKSSKSLLGTLFGVKKEHSFLSFPCPKPTTLAFLVLNKGSKEPLAGASLFFRFGFDSWFPLGKTDEKGRARFEVPEFRTGYRALGISVQKEGFAGANAFVNNLRTSIQGRSEKGDHKKPLKEIVFSLEKQEPRSGKVLGGAGQGIPGAVVRWEKTVFSRKEGNSTWTERGRIGYSLTKEDGTFRLSSLPSNLRRLKLSVYLPPAQWKELIGAQASFALPDYPLISRSLSSPPKKKNLLFDLRTLRLLPFRVLGPDGAPAPFCRIRWKGGYNASLETRGDRKGRGFLLIPKRNGCLYGFLKGVGYFINDDAETPEGKGFVLEEKMVNLQTFTTFLKGKVVDAKGNPLEGVSIGPSGWSMRGSNMRTYAVQEFNYFFLSGQKTDKGGHFSFPFLEDPSLTLSLRFRSKRMSSEIKVSQAQEDLEVILR